MRTHSIDIHMRVTAEERHISKAIMKNRTEKRGKKHFVCLTTMRRWTVAVCLVAGALSAAAEVLPPLKVRTLQERDVGRDGRWEKESIFLYLSLFLSFSDSCSWRYDDDLLLSGREERSRVC